VLERHVSKQNILPMAHFETESVSWFTVSCDSQQTKLLLKCSRSLFT